MVWWKKLHGKGTYVKSQLRNMSPAQAEHCMDVQFNRMSTAQGEIDTWQTEIQDYVSAAGFRYNNNLKHSMDGTNLSLACLGPHLIPTKQVIELFLKNEELVKKMNGLYPQIEGIIEMREAACSLLNQRNVDVDVSDTLITVGSQQAIRLIVRTFIGPGDIVVVSAPTYPGILNILKNRGAMIIEVPVDQDGMDMMALLTVCESYPVKMVYTMPSFHNPTGAVMSLERKSELLELADHHNFIILEDDVCGQLTYDGSTLPLKALDKNGRVLYVLGFSKVYGHAYRLSVITASNKLLPKVTSIKSSSDGGAPLINQLIMASFIGSDAQKHYLTDITSHLGVVRDEVYTALKRTMPEYVKIDKPRGGMHFWMTFPKDFNCNLLHYKSLEKYKINFLPGEFCYNSKQGRNQMRLCFTSTGKRDVIDAVKKIASVVDEIYEISQMF